MPSDGTEDCELDFVVVVDLVVGTFSCWPVFQGGILRGLGTPFFLSAMNLSKSEISGSWSISESVLVLLSPVLLITRADTVSPELLLSTSCGCQDACVSKLMSKSGDICFDGVSVVLAFNTNAVANVDDNDVVSINRLCWFKKKSNDTIASIPSIA